MSPTPNHILQQQLEALRKLGGMTFHPEEQIIFEGNKIKLPVGTTIPQNMKALAEYQQEQEQRISYGRTYNYRPWDVAYVAVQALSKHFGLTSHKGTFMSPPALIDVQVDIGKVVQVPWGVFQISQLPNVKFSFGDDTNDYGLVGRIGASGPKENAAEVQGVFNLVEQELALNSIYKGKAIDGQTMPNFIDVRSLDETKIVYSEEVLSTLQASVFGPLMFPEASRKLGLPLKKAVLLKGEFGTGKTLFLKWAAKVAVEADQPWTAITVRPGRDNVEDALKTARAYAPALVMVEDVDTVASADLETERISKMLDMFDGMDAKGQDVMVILTTNYAEQLHAGMLRPGRLDDIIEIGAPDAQGITKLVQANTDPSCLSDTIEWDRVAEAMDGYLPAFVVRAAAKAVESYVFRNDGETENIQLDTEDLVAAAHRLRPHWDLHRRAKTGHEEPELDRAVKHLVALAIEGKLDPRVLVED